MAKPVYTTAALLPSSGSSLTYGFLGFASRFPYGQAAGLLAISAAQKAAATLASAGIAGLEPAVDTDRS